MPDVPTLLAFMAAAVLLVAIPGPAVFYIVNRGISQGRRAAVVSAIGIETGALVHVLGATIGLSALIASSRELFLVVKYAGAAYLILLGILAWRSRDDDHIGPRPLRKTSLRRLYAQGVVVNVSNPKVGIFFLAFLPQFVVPGNGAVWLQMLVLGGVFLVVATVLDIAYALASGFVGEWLSRRERIARLRNRISGIAYVGLGTMVGVSDRRGRRGVWSCRQRNVPISGLFARGSGQRQETSAPGNPPRAGVSMVPGSPRGSIPIDTVEPAPPHNGTPKKGTYSMRNSQDRIEVTHVGSLPRFEKLREANRLRLEQGGDLEGFDDILRESVSEVVAKQKACGVTIPNDGEYGKAMSGKVDYGAWWSYSFQRLGGLEIREGGLNVVPPQESKPGDIRLTNFANRRDWTEFADAYQDPTAGIALGDTAERAFPVQVGPVTYIGQDQVQADIANMKVAMEANGVDEGFITAVSPGSAARIGNEYYGTEEEFIYACADALKEEYKAIVDAGLILQIDDPSIAENWDQIVPEPSVEDYRKFTQIRVDAINHALQGIPEDRVRVHICWGSWHGPHTTDIEFRHIVDLVLQINAKGYTFEAANARHEHEWKVWEGVKLPEGKIIIPGIVGHATNVVEHPELVADRIENFAKLVGRENVVASTDCGLGGRIHEHIAWAKLESLAQGAEIATKRLWG